MSHSDPHIVAEIFSEIGVVFSLLGELEILLNSKSKAQLNIFECDLIALRAATKRFGEDIDRMCLHIKNRTLMQIRSNMKRHAYEDARLPYKKSQILSSQNSSQRISKNSKSGLSQSQSSKSAEITLNMLNAIEQETDVENLSVVNKLEYNSVDC